MLLSYIDESYDKAEYWLTALVVPDASALGLQNDLDRVVEDAAASYDVEPHAELHGYALVQGEEDWTNMKKMIRARIKIYTRALEAIASYDGVEVAFRGIDIAEQKRRYSTPWHPHRVAIDFMCQSLNSMASGRSSHFLAIADEIDQADTLRASYWEFQRSGTLSYFSGKADRAVDTLHFAPSKHSRLLQASDLISYLHFRIRRSGVTDRRAVKANQDLWDIIKGKTRVRGLWPGNHTLWPL